MTRLIEGKLFIETTFKTMTTFLLRPVHSETKLFDCSVLKLTNQANLDVQNSCANNLYYLY